MNDEKAIEQLEEFLVIDDWSAVYMPYLQDAIEYAINRIKALEERPQGEWQETNVLWETNCGGGMGYDYGYYFKCSACGKQEVDKTNFCSNCGAKMQKGNVE